MKILITGLSDSGKTYLAMQLKEHLECDYFNADSIREQYNDWDFSIEGRERQCDRMVDLCKTSKKPYQIADFIAPTAAIRDKFNPDFIIWMNTTKSSKFEDTDRLYQVPHNFDIELCSFEYDVLNVVNFITHRN